MIEKGLVIPDGTTEIPMRKYKDAKNVGVPVFPASLKTIGSGAFYCSDIKVANIPEGVAEIGANAFAFCEKLKEAKIPESVIKMGDNCFAGAGLEKVTIEGNGLSKIGRAAFADCEKLKNLEIPKSVQEIEALAFSGSAIENFVIHNKVLIVGFKAFDKCKDIFVETKNGTLAKVPSNRFNQDVLVDSLRAFIENRTHKYNFIPQPEVINNTPYDLIKGFYSNSRGWEEVLNEYCKAVGEEEVVTYRTRKSLYKISLAMGLFSNSGTEREKAKQFILKNIVGKYEPNILIQKYENLNTWENGYNKEFAKFVLNNYTDINFLEVDINNDHQSSMFSRAYNYSFDEYMALTNKVVKTNKRVDKLTEENLKTHIIGKKYSLDEEDKSNEKIQQLANYCATFGCSQKQFETLKDWFKEGINKGSNIKCLKDTKTEGMTFEFLEKDNPLGAVIGEITNCCQAIGDSGEDCLKHGMTNKNGGFIAFRWNNRIIGQAWVWYNPRAKKICLDNIEVPNSAIGIVEKHEEEFYHCIYRTAESLIKGMKQAGVDVEFVTTGIGHNDTAEILQNSGFKTVGVKSKIENAFASQVLLLGGAPSKVYTDTSEGEIVLYQKENQI